MAKVYDGRPFGKVGLGRILPTYISYFSQPSWTSEYSLGLVDVITLSNDPPGGGGGDTEPGDDFSAVVILDIEMVFRETTKSKAVPSFPRAVVGPKIAQNICVFGYDRSVST